MSKDILLYRAVQSQESVSYAGISQLWANEVHLPRYNKDIVQKLSQGMPINARVLEFGAGIGSLAQIWAQETGIKPICLEIDPNLQKIIRDRGFDCYSNLEDVNGLFDLIYSSNVLEHIEDDQKALEQLYQKLKPGGILTLYLPAFQCLYSNFDAAIGHYRRYEKAELMIKIKNAYFIIQRCEYTDSIGFFAWMMTKNKKFGQETKHNIGQLKFYDRFIFPVSATLDMLGMKHILGKNLLVIARKQ